MTTPIASLEQVCASFAEGTCRLVFSARVDDELARITNLEPSQLAGRRFIVVAWDRLPSHSSLLEEVIDRLADSAKSLWPDWYIYESSELSEKTSLQSLLSGIQLAEVERSVLPRWLFLADRASRTQHRPRFKDEFTAETEIRQLALALGARSCQLVLVVRGECQDAVALASLARTTEWLLRETNMSILVMVPVTLESATELDSISFDSVLLNELLPIHPAECDEDKFDIEAGIALPSTSLNSSQLGESTPIRTHSTLFIHPLIGRPHPDSRGEQLLWASLEADSELTGMFQCNVWTTTVCASTYLVDFVWRHGRVVVEVDGYYWHSSRHQFSFDRRRDYELLLSGYVVIRIPHDELISDIGSAVAKIRRLVQLRPSERL